MSSNSLYRGNSVNEHANVADFEASNIHVLEVHASHFDNIIMRKIEANEQSLANDDETAHYTDKFELNPRGLIKEGEHHCRDPLLNNEILKEVQKNRDLWSELEKEAALERENALKSPGKPSLLGFLCSGSDTLEAKFQKLKFSKNIERFERNTNKVIKAEQKLNNAISIANQHYSQYRTLLKSIEGNDSEDVKIKANPELAEKARLSMAASKHLLKTIDDVTTNILDKNTLDSCAESVAKDFESVITHCQSNEMSDNIKNMAKLVEDFAGVYDRDLAGNVFEDDGALKEENNKALKEFVENIQNLINRFLGVTPNSSATSTLSPR
ncbi:hypothetical protein [Vibrio anguillarum]|uniref:hypothetical protein n=5 Tax=Vibrio anguillarum TaxID=55601 RepID=UPI000BB489BB|nr:hypothetical protein [Vibrio anguillarum]ATC60080.1 hypothetical protein CMV05_21980 [Vibrio anguillarum]MBF4249433.1 hypothetical protein [Vibrio anguillarum]MBF4341242.1 hypothetical protein [Vibrio anguillarum]